MLYSKYSMEHNHAVELCFEMFSFREQLEHDVLQHQLHV